MAEQLGIYVCQMQSYCDLMRVSDPHLREGVLLADVKKCWHFGLQALEQEGQPKLQCSVVCTAMGLMSVQEGWGSVENGAQASYHMDYIQLIHRCVRDPRPRRWTQVRTSQPWQYDWLVSWGFVSLSHGEGCYLEIVTLGDYIKLEKWKESQILKGSLSIWEPNYLWKLWENRPLS